MASSAKKVNLYLRLGQATYNSATRASRNGGTIKQVKLMFIFVSPKKQH